MDDVISRQTALDALNHELICGAVINQCGLEAAYEVIEDLPSAQLNTYWKEQCQSYEQTINKLRESLSTQPEIIRCKDCKYFNSECHYCDYFQWNITFDNFCSKAERREVTE